MEFCAIFPCLTINGSLKVSNLKPVAEIIRKDTTKVDLTVNDKLNSMVVILRRTACKSASLTGFMVDSIWSGTGMSITGQPLENVDSGKIRI